MKNTYFSKTSIYTDKTRPFYWWKNRRCLEIIIYRAVFESTAKFLVIVVRILAHIISDGYGWVISLQPSTRCEDAHVRVSVWVCAVGVGKTCKWVAGGDWLSVVATAEWSQRRRRQQQQQQQKRIIILHESSNNHPRFRSTNVLPRWACCITVYLGTLITSLSRWIIYLHEDWSLV